MIKNIKNIVLSLFCFGLLIFTSCEKDDYTGDSTLTPNNSSATLSFSLPSTLTETDTSFIYTVTIDNPQIVDTKIPVRLGDATTATADEDFTYTNLLTIPAYKTTASGELVITADCDVEETEVVELVVGNDVTPNVSFGKSSNTISLGNYTTETLEISCDWGGTALVADSIEYSLCDSVDFDMFLEDSEGNQITSSETGACPEVMFTENLPDGDYSVYGLLWNNRIPQDTIINEVISIPVSVTFLKGGCGKVSNDPVTDSQSTGSAASNAVFDFYDYYYYGNPYAYVKIATITVAGENYSWVME